MPRHFDHLTIVVRDLPRAREFFAVLGFTEAMMKLPQTGGCQCGKLRYNITEEPRSVYTCHCLEC